VPTEAVLEDSHVLVYGSGDGVLERRQFKAGISNWRYTEVLSELALGERIVLSVDREGVTAGALVKEEGDPAEGASD
jgi:HlyD family secretion protein